MKSKPGIQKAAKKLSKMTGASYEKCLVVLRTYKNQAEKLKDTEPDRPFQDCLIATGLSHIPKQAHPK